MKKYLIKFRSQEKDCVESCIIEEVNLLAAIIFASNNHKISYYDIFHVEELEELHPENENTTNDDCIPPFPIDILFSSILTGTAT